LLAAVIKSHGLVYFSVGPEGYRPAGIGTYYFSLDGLAGKVDCH